MDIRDIRNFYKNKKVIITGHTGFKGSWLSYILDDLGSKVMGYSLAPKTSPSLFSCIQFSKNFRSVLGDIRDESNFSSLVHKFKPDIIFHLAAQPIVISSYENPRDTFDTNFTGTLNLLESIRELKNNCSLIIITSDKVYENNGEKISFKEEDKLGGNDPYSASKSACEILAHSYSQSFFLETNIKLATVRAGNVIGGGDWADYRLVPDIIKSNYERKKLLIRNPLHVRPWQHVLEPLFGYIELSINLTQNPLKYSGSWNFGPMDNQVKSVSELIQEIAKNDFKLNISFEKNEFKESKFLSLDISKSLKNLIWKPKWDFEKTILRTINWYKEFYKGKEVNKLIKSDINNYLS